MLKLALKIIKKVFFYGLIVIGLLWLIFNWPVRSKNEEMKFNVSFSQLYANSLGLDWKMAYQEILKDLKPKKIRLVAYWTEIEKKEGQYDWADLDWMVEKAGKNNTEITLALGIKVPRWPECFIPEFYLKDKAERERALLRYEKALIKRYRDNPAITMWQVENEPFLPFGDCVSGAVDEDLLDREISLVKLKDKTRPILTTDSGELGLWLKAAKRGDVFGTTLYRIIYKKPLGYIHYPLGPNFFRIKARLIKLFVRQEKIIIAELQAEPWSHKWILDSSITEQYKSMNPDKFKEIIEYSRKTKFSEAYLWGVEWWYWLKTVKEDERMWEEAKKVIQNK